MAAPKGISLLVGCTLALALVVGCDAGAKENAAPHSRIERGDSSGVGSPSAEAPGGSAAPTDAFEATTEAPATTSPAAAVPEPTAAPQTPAPPPNAAPQPAGKGVAVVDVIDGDTIKVAGGQRIRLIGIDTPERGECGYTEAAFVLAALIKGRPVVLVPGARDDTDRYGRLLRYVEVDGADLNLEMIRSGRAISRYDSRDGYGRHARQDSYVTADNATASTNTCNPPPSPAPKIPSPAPAPAPAPGGGGGTDPRFGTCKQAKKNGYGPYTRGVDPEYDWYRDGDSDGVNCE